MTAGTIDHVKHDAARVARHQPVAHAAWQFSYRKSRFRSAVANFERALFAMTVETFSDDQVQALDDLVRVVIKIVEVQLSNLDDGARDLIDARFYEQVLVRLSQAAEGLEQGLSPDPEKRPTSDQLLDRMAKLLEANPINLSHHTGCTPASIS